MIAVWYLVCTRADLDGVGNESSSFLSRHICDVFKCQSDLFENNNNNNNSERLM